MVFNHVELQSTLLLLPFTLLEIYIFSLGLSLFLSAAFVKYRDVSYIWEVLLQAGFYATPILYALSRIPNVTVQKLLLMNPMAQAIQEARYQAVTHETITISKLFDGGAYALIPLGIVAVTLVVGVLYFKKEAKYFAENI